MRGRQIVITAVSAPLPSPRLREVQLKLQLLWPAPRTVEPNGGSAEPLRQNQSHASKPCLGTVDIPSVSWERRKIGGQIGVFCSLLTTHQALSRWKHKGRR